VYQLRFDNRLKPRWVKDWIMGELRVKYTRKELSWWLHPKDRNEQPIDGSWSLAQKFSVATGPTVIGEDGNEEEYLLDYLLGIFAPGKEKKPINQLNMFLIFQSSCTAQLPVIDIPVVTNEDEEDVDHFHTHLKKEAAKTTKKAAQRKDTSAARKSRGSANARPTKKVCEA
jgi:hypothetical protein